MDLIEGSGAIAIIFIVLAIFIVVQVFYLITASNTLKAVRPEYRKVDPGQVWLGMIPLFHLIWPFIINPKIVASIQADMEARGHGEAGDYGKQLGMIYPGLRFGGYIPVIGSLFTLGYLVVFIIWWVKLNGYKQRLQASHYSQELLDN